ncbi:MAG TPA: hypothetical protein DD738_09530 [Ruminiclostridium sp.]|mgnify:FL=1|jgi:hypothetical protein|nr:hypothetical protein [Ruminiclostridium sp.]
MDQSFRFIVVAAATYLAFLCVIRLVLGTQYKVKSFLINVIGMITVYGSLLISRYGNFLKLPVYLYYILPALLTVFLPPLSLKMKSDQVLKYLGYSILALPIIHILFSFLLGWGELLPFIKVPSLWNII